MSYGQLALDADWKSFTEYPVTGRSAGIFTKKKFSFADYYTDVVDRSWTKGNSTYTGLSVGYPGDYSRLIGTEYIQKKQTLFFALRDSTGTRTEVMCVSDYNQKDFTIGNNPVSLINIFGDLAKIKDESSSFYYVQIYTGANQKPWHLLLNNNSSQQFPAEYQTRLAQSLEEYYTILPHTMIKSKKGKVGHMPFGSAGFTIRNKQGEPVAAVSMMDKGMVYLTELSAEEKALLASACAALLLQEVI